MQHSAHPFPPVSAFVFIHLSPVTRIKSNLIESETNAKSSHGDSNSITCNQSILVTFD
jgi:hypothetical protein